MDDITLLQKFIEGEDSALTQLVERYQKELFGFIYRHVNNQTDAEDITQKVFVNLFVKAEQFGGRSSFKTWLYQIAINQCKNHYRSNDRRRLDDVEIETLDLSSNEDFAAEFEYAQRRRLLQEAVDKLPTKQRMTVKLRLYQDCTFPEIAEIMTASVGTAKAHYHQAVVSLRKTLQKEEYEFN